MQLRINNLALNINDTGNPNGLPVILIHGFPFSGRMWEPQVAVLQEIYRVITYDIRGHGDSDVGDGHYSIEFFVDDLFGIMDELELSQAVIGGLSMGGYIALRAMEREPNRFKGLVLCDTRSEADANAVKINRANTIKAIKQNGVQVFAGDFVKKIFAKETFKSHPAVVYKIKKIIQSTSPESICSTLLALAARTDTTDVLGKINVPTLLVFGEFDDLTPPEIGEEIHQQITESEFHIVPRAAHISNMENPTFFNEALLGFLARIF